MNFNGLLKRYLSQPIIPSLNSGETPLVKVIQTGTYILERNKVLKSPASLVSYDEQDFLLEKMSPFKAK